MYVGVFLLENIFLHWASAKNGLCIMCARNDWIFDQIYYCQEQQLPAHMAHSSFILKGSWM